MLGGPARASGVGMVTRSPVSQRRFHGVRKESRAREAACAGQRVCGAVWPSAKCPRAGVERPQEAGRDAGEAAGVPSSRVGFISVAFSLISMCILSVLPRATTDRVMKI